MSNQTLILWTLASFTCYVGYPMVTGTLVGVGCILELARSLAETVAYLARRS